MNHRFFEERLFVDEPLPEEEAVLLEEHLQTCERCRALRAAWQETELELKLTQWVSPLEGFSQRWWERYAHQVKVAQQRRAFAVFLLTSAAAAFFAFPFFALLAAPSQPLWLKIVIALYNFSALLPLIDGISTFLFTVFRVVVQVLPPSLELAFGVAFLGLILIWLRMLRKFSFGRFRQP